MTDTPTPLDPQVLNRLREAMEGSGIDLVGELIDMFLVDGPEMVAGIRDAHATGDTAALADVVHGLRGSVANLGAVTLAQLCTQVEGAAREGNGTPVEEVLERLFAEFERVVAALRVEHSSDSPTSPSA